MTKLEGVGTTITVAPSLEKAMKVTPAWARRFAATTSNDGEGVVTGGDDDCTPPGSGAVGSCTRGCFARLSSSVFNEHSFQFRISLA